jgi:RimJ/RimL family protein N-acetyltransferase
LLPAHVDHARAFAAYVVQHVAESGRDGAPHFAVTSAVVPDEVRAGAIERWSRPLEEPLWGRAWLLWTRRPAQLGPAGFGERSARVVGHIELRGGRVRAELHRAVLAMGMLLPYRGQGHGRRLLQTAIEWARDEARLSYLDLGVFVGNDRARRLYEQMGFVVQGLRCDAFRVDGSVIDDIPMTLALNPGR